MLQIQYTFKVKYQNLKFIKLNFFILNLMWMSLNSNLINIKQVKKTKKLKTLMLSPFHYKIAKKNLIKNFYNFSMLLDINKIEKKKLTFIIFKYWWYYNIYFIYLGLKNVNFYVK